MLPSCRDLRDRFQITVSFGDDVRERPLPAHHPMPRRRSQRVVSDVVLRRIGQVLAESRSPASDLASRVVGRVVSATPAATFPFRPPTPISSRWRVCARSDANTAQAGSEHVLGASMGPTSGPAGCRGSREKSPGFGRRRGLERPRPGGGPPPGEHGLRRRSQSPNCLSVTS